MNKAAASEISEALKKVGLDRERNRGKVLEFHKIREQVYEILKFSLRKVKKNMSMI